MCRSQVLSYNYIVGGKITAKLKAFFPLTVFLVSTENGNHKIVSLGNVIVKKQNKKKTTTYDWLVRILSLQHLQNHILEIAETLFQRAAEPRLKICAHMFDLVAQLQRSQITLKSKVKLKNRQINVLSEVTMSPWRVWSQIRGREKSLLWAADAVVAGCLHRAEPRWQLLGLLCRTGVFFNLFIFFVCEVWEAEIMQICKQS